LADIVARLVEMIRAKSAFSDTSTTSVVAALSPTGGRRVQRITPSGTGSPDATP
jgi:hypothetical protein